MKTRRSTRLACVSGLSFAALLTSAANAQRTTFTYQGRLEESGVPANGAYDFCFRLFNDFSGGELIGLTTCATSVEVVNGLFTVDLDFDQQYGTPEDRYLEIDVCPNGDGLSCAVTTGNASSGAGFITLQPRQRITSAPRAIHANSAFALDSPSGVHANAVFVDSAGNVGIGTNVPGTKLHVVGPLTISNLGDQADALVLGIERSWVFRQHGTGAGAALKLQSIGGGGNKNFIIETTGGVGIGTTAPGTRLHVDGGSDLAVGSGGFLTLGATAGPNIGFDNNEIMARNNGATTILHLQADGGDVSVAGNTRNGRLGVNIFTPAFPLHVGTSSSNGNGAHLTAGGVWTNGSDRNTKTDLRNLDRAEILQKVAALPVTQWRYLAEPESVSHIGPMAQDFRAAFGLGETDTHIGTLDADGVALAAIQGLYEIVQERVCQLDEMRVQKDNLVRRNDELESRLSALESLVARFVEEQGSLDDEGTDAKTSCDETQ